MSKIIFGKITEIWRAKPRRKNNSKRQKKRKIYSTKARISASLRGINGIEFKW